MISTTLPRPSPGSHLHPVGAALPSLSGNPPYAENAKIDVPKGDFALLATLERVEATHRNFLFPSKKRHVHVVDSQHTIKWGPRVTDYEYRILQMLNYVDDIPVPRPLDFFEIKVTCTRSVWTANKEVERKEVVDTWGVIIMTTVPGKRIGDIFPKVPVSDYYALMRGVDRCLDKINVAIEKGIVRWRTKDGEEVNPVVPSDTISNLDGTQCLKFPAFDGTFNHPVTSHEFIETMSKTKPQFPDSPAAHLLRTHLSLLCPLPREGTFKASDKSNNLIRFCHMDLGFANILFQDGELSGFVDWEFAGWYTPALESYLGLVNVAFTEAAEDLLRIYSMHREMEEGVIQAARDSEKVMAGYWEWVDREWERRERNRDGERQRETERDREP